jgi:hypothetical protein
MMRIILATIAGMLALTIMQGVTGTFWPPAAPPPPVNAVPWGIASNLLMALTLTVFASRARWHGSRLAAALFAIAFSIGHLSAFIEAVFFDVIPLRDVPTFVPMFTLPLAACIVTVIATLRVWRKPARAEMPSPLPTASFLVSRGALAAILYTCCYFVAGTFVWPYVRDFYASRQLPATGAVAAMQLLVRGPLLAAALTLVARMLPGSRRLHAAAGAAAMSLFLGVIPLIVPNPILPDHVRWAHFVETVASGFPVWRRRRMVDERSPCDTPRTRAPRRRAWRGDRAWVSPLNTDRTSSAVAPSCEAAQSAGRLRSSPERAPRRDAQRNRSRTLRTSDGSIWTRPRLRTCRTACSKGAAPRSRSPRRISSAFSRSTKRGRPFAVSSRRIPTRSQTPRRSTPSAKPARCGVPCTASRFC